MRRREALRAAALVGAAAIAGSCRAGASRSGTPRRSPAPHPGEKKMPEKRPNILFIMSDDHASHAMSCYGSRINRTPHLDRIAEGGMRFDNCFCTNSICTPSRAAILAGTYNHVNGVTTLATHMDNRLLTFPKLLQGAGYQTAIVGKWHLGQGEAHWPTGFDYWNVLPGQGLYHDPVMIEMGEEKTFPGYTTDITTDYSLKWLRERDPETVSYTHLRAHET